MKYVPGVALYVLLSAGLSATGVTVGQRSSVVNECEHAVVTQQEDFPLVGIETFVEVLLQQEIQQISYQKRKHDKENYWQRQGYLRQITEVQVECRNRKDPVILRCADNGIVHFYSDGTTDPEETSRLGYDSALSLEDAFAAAVDFLRYYKLSTEVEDYCVSFNDYAEISTGARRDLYSAQWTFSQQFYMEGLPCRGSGCLVSVSAYDGRVRSLHYYPALNPLSSEESIVESDAVAIAKAWVLEQGKDGGCVFPDGIRKVIAFRGFEDDVGGKSLPGQQMPTSAYSCYEVGIAYSRESHERYLAIRVDNGEVIGSYYPYSISETGVTCIR